MARAAEDGALWIPVSAERLSRMRSGAEALWRWLDDTATHGIAALQDSRASLDERVARLHDDQLAGLARWLDFVGERVGDGDRWPTVVAGELGRIAIAARAWTRWDGLDDDVRAALLLRSGVSVRRRDVAEHGTKVPGLWTVVGEHLSEDDRGLWTRRTVFLGPRPAFSISHQFGSPPAPGPGPGLEGFATLAFWPGAGAHRALVIDFEPTGEWDGQGATDLHGTLARIARTYAVNPLTQRVPVALRDVRVTVDAGRAFVVNADGQALPVQGLVWDAVTATAGGTATLAGWWTGRAVAVAGLLTGGGFQVVDAVDEEPVPSETVGYEPDVQLLVAGADRDVLLRVGVTAVVRRAAPVPHRIKAPVPVNDPRPALAAPDVRVLDAWLRDHPDKVDAVVEALQLRGQRATGALLTRLLGSSSVHWRTIDRVLGPHARHIATLQDRWRWAVDAPLDAGWDVPALRTQVLYAALRADRDAAIAALTARWQAVERADDRLALLDTAAPALLHRDLPWLEGLLDDPSVRVRRRAADLQTRWVDSPLVQRMAVRAGGLWPKGARIVLPTSVDREALRDGLGPDLSTLSARERVWHDVVARVPPAHWDRTQLQTGAAASALVRSALAESIERFDDPVCAGDLLPWVEAGDDHRAWTQVVGTLRLAERVTTVLFALTVAGGPRVTLGLSTLGAPWSEAVTQAWRSGLDAHLDAVHAGVVPLDRGWVDSVPLAAERAPLSVRALITHPHRVPHSADLQTRALIVHLRQAAERLTSRDRLASLTATPGGATTPLVG